MPHHKSCYKRMKTSAAANARNRAYRSQMNSAIKRVLAADKKDTADAELRKASALIDKLVNKGVIHRNNADNKKSRLARLVNRIGVE